MNIILLVINGGQNRVLEWFDSESSSITHGDVAIAPSVYLYRKRKRRKLLMAILKDWENRHIHERNESDMSAACRMALVSVVDALIYSIALRCRQWLLAKCQLHLTIILHSVITVSSHQHAFQAAKTRRWEKEGLRTNRPCSPIRLEVETMPHSWQVWCFDFCHWALVVYPVRAVRFVIGASDSLLEPEPQYSVDALFLVTLALFTRVLRRNWRQVRRIHNSYIRERRYLLCRLHVGSHYNN